MDPEKTTESKKELSYKKSLRLTIINCLLVKHITTWSVLRSRKISITFHYYQSHVCGKTIAVTVINPETLLSF